MKIGLEQLREAVGKDAAIRRVQKLQPVGGAGDKIFPPTYPGERNNDPPRHVFEMRRFDFKNVLCVLIDSVQSQANRLEEALKIIRNNGLAFPVITVDFSDTDPDVADIGHITTLDAPHRVFDAIMRDSELKGERLKDTPEGKSLVEAKPQNARAVYELSPTALLFGAWNSTGEGGGIGAKFPRCIVSEIIGVGVATESRVDTRTGEITDSPSGKRTGSRVDPLGVRSGVAVYKLPNGEWSLEAPVGKKGAPTPKSLRPSEINHSNIAPSITQLGVSIDYASHNFVLSFAALRRLRFSGNSGKQSSADLAAQTALAALGLAAVTAMDRNGYFLRSRCDLVPELTSGFEIIRANGQADPIALDFDIACRLVNEASDVAKSAGIAWNTKDLVLKPQKKLVGLVKASRELALQGEAEAGDESD